MASSLSLPSVITSDSDIEKSKSSQEMSNIFQKETNNEVAGADGTSSANSEIPQWKKDLIQRRKINIAKTIAVNQSAPISTSFGAIPTVTPGTSVMAFDTKANAKDNTDKTTTRLSNTNTTSDTKNNTSQHSLASAMNVNLTLKMPGILQQHGDFDSPCGGHYTPVNNKSSGLGYNYTEKLEKLADRTLGITQEEQTHIPQTRSFSVVEQYNNEGSSTLLEENVQFQKNLTEQNESLNTTSVDSLLASTSRLSSGKKVAVAAENYKKSNKDNLLVCVSEHKTHTLQEPASNIHVSGNGNDGVDDEQPLHRQLKSGHEIGNLVDAGVCEDSLKKFDSHILKVNKTNSVTAAKISFNKKQYGVTNVDSTVLMSTTPCFVKNQKINSTLVSSHHNYKINSKYRYNQNSTPLNSASAKSVIESPSLVTNNKKKMVAVQEMNEISNNELDFDPSEELQYGPGIVSKLRCRYLSLALRQTTGKQRMSMRRATSLNNLLDDNDLHDDDEEEEEHTMDVRNKEGTCKISDTMQMTETKTSSVKFSETTGSEIKLKNISGEQPQHRSRHIKRGNDSLKRARSVEALLCEKSPWNFTDKSIILTSTNADSVTIEDKINHARDRLLLGSESPPKRLTSIIDDTERPPPDVVKQTLKIFEASANRRGRGLNKNSGGEVATKVANYKSIITQNKPIITFPKPPISPKKTNFKNANIEVKKTNTSPPTTPQNTISSVQGDKNAFLQNSTPSSSRPTAFHQKMDLTPIRNVSNVSKAESLSENSPDIIPRHKSVDKTFSTVGAGDSPITQLTKRIEHLRIESPTVVVQTQQQQTLHKGLHSRFSEESSDSDSEEDSLDGEYEVNTEESGYIKEITKSISENIVKAGTSQQFQFQPLSNGNSVKHSEPLHDIPTLPTVGSTTVKQIGVIRPLLAERNIMEGNCCEEDGEKHTSSDSTTTLTSREIEKNRINNEKKIEKPVATSSQINELYSAGITSTKKNIAPVTPKSEKGDISQPWSSAIIGRKKRTPSVGPTENNTMVFNFKDRKEVPDYIENDGLIFKRKRELPKPNESGYVMLGDLSLETSTDPEDEWPMCPPSPCDVEFENANIIIDGKSSIKNRSREIHFRVQFDDSLTSTFEYPSETSVVSESVIDSTELSITASLPTAVASIQKDLNEKKSPIIHHHVAVDEIIQLPHNNKVGNLSLGSAPLGSYTPVKAKIDNVFELGVTRIPTTIHHSEQSCNNIRADSCQDQDVQSLEYIKPASDDLTIAYSEGSLKTDLLY